ncbi:MAG: apolipoprotein N-acyltransferase, partial [Pseudomonadota bacterium]|nr:apolipoprotein N-acyltransferase [Pseudomonadota bacterium]
ISYIYGNHSINLNKEILKNTKNKINIKVISPNFKLEYGLDQTDIENRLKKLIKYSDPVKDEKTLYVWPEGVFSGYSYRDVKSLTKNFSENFSKNHFILFGINRLDKKMNGFYNSLIIVDHEMKIIQEYKKQKLVPFGEFLPFESVLSQIGLKKITEGHGSFLSGKNQNNLKFDKLNILPLICYEIIFTNLIQSSSKNTNLIVNISEDGWFGNSIGPYQHFSKSIFRAIEHNTFLVRSANKGVSAIINNKGEVVKRLNTNEAGHIQLEIPLLENKNKNKNDLIFFILLFTYVFIFYFTKKNND